jgi:integrase
MSVSGRIQHGSICGEAVRNVVYKYARQCGFDISPHDLRRTYAKLAHKNGAKIDQIQLNLGHQSLATTQVYLGNELDLKNGPGDFLDIQIE